MDLLLAALDRADEHLGLRDRRQLHERFAAQRRVGRKLEFEQLDLAAEEGVGLDSRRNAQRPRHLRRADQLRIDGQAQPQIVGNERQFPRVFRVPDAGNGVLRADLLRNEAAQQIQLVRRRHCDQQVCGIHACLDLRLIGRAVSLDAENIERFRRLLKRIGAVVYNGNVMSFPGELLGKRAADLAVSDNDDLHVIHS